MTSASVVSINSQLKHYTHTRQTFSTPGYCFNHKCLPSRSYNYLYEDMRLSAVYIAVPLAWSLVSVIQMQPVHVIRMRLLTGCWPQLAQHWTSTQNRAKQNSSDTACGEAMLVKQVWYQAPMKTCLAYETTSPSLQLSVVTASAVTA